MHVTKINWNNYSTQTALQILHFYFGQHFELQQKKDFSACFFFAPARGTETKKNRTIKLN